MKQTPQLEEVQAKMAPGVLTLKGFLGEESRKLSEILAQDQMTLAHLGFSQQKIADRLEHLSKEGAQKLEGETFLEDRYRVTYREDRGLIPCPWGDGRFEKGETTVVDSQTNKTFRWNSLTLHMIRVHGFFSGKGSYFRLEPSELIKDLEFVKEDSVNTDLVKLICSRRSIRKFTQETPSDQVIEEILKAAMHAPSAGNEQPWNFLLIRDRKLLDAIPEFHPYAHALKNCAVAVLVCGNLQLEKFPGNWPLDCSAASQNILLATHFLGLGAVWLGIHPEVERIDGCRRLFNIPNEIIPFSLIPIGYFQGPPTHVDRYKSDRVFLNDWSNLWKQK